MTIPSSTGTPPLHPDRSPEPVAHGMSANPIAELIETWLGHAEFACAYRYGDGWVTGTALRRCATELQAVVVAMHEETVSLKEGARRSGYSARQLSRFISEGRLKNLGSKARPKLAVRDLPRALGLAGDR